MFFFFFKISSQYLSTPKTFTFNIHQKTGFPGFLKKTIQKNRCSNIGPMFPQGRELASAVHTRLLYSLKAFNFA